MKYDYSISVLERQVEQGMECFALLYKNSDGKSVKDEGDKMLSRIRDLQAAINKLKEWNQ